MSSRTLSPLWIALAAMLWGSDLLLRSQVVAAGWSPSYIVLTEHLLLTAAFVVPLWQGRLLLARLSQSEWAALVFVGVGGSALATWLYTTAFALDFSRALQVALLQKTQPIFALLMAGAFLGERRSPTFWAWAALAVLGACLLVVEDRGFHRHTPAGFGMTQGLLAIAASFLWGAATVAGRPLAVKLPPALLAGARFTLAVPVLALLSVLSVPPPASARTPEIAGTLCLIALLPGLLGMALYYRGLRGTTASAATLLELCYPLTSLLIGLFALYATVTPGQWLGIALLLGAVVGLGREPGVAVHTS